MVFNYYYYCDYYFSFAKFIYYYSNFPYNIIIISFNTAIITTVNIRKIIGTKYFATAIFI